MRDSAAPNGPISPFRTTTGWPTSHFSIGTAVDAVTLVDLSDGKGVQVDGEKQSTCQLHNGRRFKAGNMIFAIATELQFDTSGADRSLWRVRQRWPHRRAGA